MKKAKAILSAVLAASMVTTALAGCTGGKDASSKESKAPSSSSEAKKESSESKASGKAINYWSMWQNTEPQAKVIQEAADAYTKKTGVKVNITWKGRDINKVILAAIEGGQDIDVFDDGLDRMPGYVKDLMDLDDMAEKADYAKHSNASLVDFNKKSGNGKLTAIAYQPYTSGIFYDKASFKKAKIDKTPETWDEFLDVCKKLKAAGIQPLAQDDAYANLALGYQLARYIGQDGVIDVVKNNKWKEEPAVKKSLNDIENLIKKGYYAKGTPSVYPKGENTIGYGKTAMILNASWVPNEIQNNTKCKLEWGFFPYPAVKGGKDGTDVAMVGGQSFAINKNSKNAQEAFDFIMMVTTGEYDQKMATETNGIPTDPNNTKWPELIACCKDSFTKLTKAYKWDCGIDDNQDTKDIIKDNMLKVFEGKQTPDQFIANMEKNK